MSSEKDTQVSTITTPSGVATTGTTTNRNRNRRKGNKDATNEHVSTVSASTRARASNFKGHTTEMNGHVFQLFSESGSEKQYQNTLDMLCEYIRKHVEYSDDMISLTKKLVTPTIPKPTPIDEKTANSTEKEMFSLECKDAYKRTKHLDKNLKSIYAVIWGQCSLNMQGQLKSVTGFTTADDTSDCIWLLKNVKGAAFSFDDERYIISSLDDHLEKYVRYRQGPDEDLLVYLAQYNILVEVYEHYGGVFTGGPAVLTTIPDPRGVLTYADRKALLRDRFLAYGFLKRSDPKRFGSLLVELTNQYARGKDEYPLNMSGAYKMLHSYVKEKIVIERHVPSSIPNVSSRTEPSNMTFAQAGDVVPGSDGITRPQISCNKCNKHGHFPDKCITASGVQMFQTVVPASPHFSFSQFVFNQNQLSNDIIPPEWVLLDSQSTVSVFRNPLYLRNIRDSVSHMTVATNGGYQVSTQVGDVENFGPVWYNPKSLANIFIPCCCP